MANVKKQWTNGKKQVNFMSIMKPGDRCRHMLQQDLLAMGHCLIKELKDTWGTVTQRKPPWDLTQYLLTGTELTHGIVAFSKHDSSQIHCHLTQWGKGRRIRACSKWIQWNLIWVLRRIMFKKSIEMVKIQEGSSWIHRL